MARNKAKGQRGRGRGVVGSSSGPVDTEGLAQASGVVGVTHAAREGPGCPDPQRTREPGRLTPTSASPAASSKSPPLPESSQNIPRDVLSLQEGQLSRPNY